MDRGGGGVFVGTGSHEKSDGGSERRAGAGWCREGRSAPSSSSLVVTKNNARAVVGGGGAFFSSVAVVPPPSLLAPLLLLLYVEKQPRLHLDIVGSGGCGGGIIE